MKITAIKAALLAVAIGLAVAFTGCSAPATVAADPTAPIVATEPAASASPEVTVSASPTVAATDEPVATSDYAVTIDGAEKAKDYQKRAVLIVSYTFTNNSNEAQSFIFAVVHKAFQNGVQLEDAIVTDGKHGSANSMKEIKPGATIKVYEAYVLDDKKAPVQIEVGESFSLDESLIASKTIKIS